MIKEWFRKELRSPGYFMQKVFLYCVDTQRSAGSTVIAFIKTNLRRELQHLMTSHLWNEFYVLMSCGNVYNVLCSCVRDRHKSRERSRPGRQACCLPGVRPAFARARVLLCTEDTWRTWPLHRAGSEGEEMEVCQACWLESRTRARPVWTATQFFLCLCTAAD